MKWFTRQEGWPWTKTSDHRSEDGRGLITLKLCWSWPEIHRQEWFHLHYPHKMSITACSKKPQEQRWRKKKGNITTFIWVHHETFMMWDQHLWYERLSLNIPGAEKVFLRQNAGLKTLKIELGSSAFLHHNILVSSLWEERMNLLCSLYLQDPICPSYVYGKNLFLAPHRLPIHLLQLLPPIFLFTPLQTISSAAAIIFFPHHSGSITLPPSFESLP